MASILKYLEKSFVKRPFDPNSRKDLRIYKHFVETGGWGEVCPFELEWPYLNIPHMCAEKLTKAVLAKIK
jgi:hypothetical protein